MFENIISELGKSSLLASSLHGMRTLLERELDLKNLLIGTNDTMIAEFRRKNHLEYPHAYLVITELIGVRDQNNTRNIQRLGIIGSVDNALKATSSKGFIFPVNVAVELHYSDNDPMRVLIMAEALAMLSMMGGLSFSMSCGGIEYTVRLEIPDSTSIPLGSAESSNAPDATEMSINIVMHTYAGFFKDVSAVQKGSADTSLIIQKEFP